MHIPQGFQLDPQSGLYYKEEYGEDAGVSVRIVTWFDSQSGATQEVRYPAEPTQTAPPPLSEAEPLLEPPPEPLLVPTGLPEQNPYAAQQAAYPPPLLQEVYDGSEIPQPIPQKKKKAAFFAAAVGVVVLAAVGVCGWQFGWFGGQNVPVDAPVSTPPAVSAAEAASEPSSLEPSAAPSKPEESAEQQKGSPDFIEKPELVADVGVEINYHSKTSADIALTNLHMQDGYPTKIPGMDVHKGDFLYDWDISVAGYALSLMYFSEEDGEDKTITVSDMYSVLYHRTDDIFVEVDCSVYDDRIIFYNVTLPESSDVDFSSPETVYEILIQEGLSLGAKEMRATVTQAGTTGSSGGQLATKYRYDSEASSMFFEVELKPEAQTFQLAVDIGLKVVHASGKYSLQDDNVLVLKAEGDIPASWKGDMKLLLLPDGNLQLQSPEGIGLFPPGVTLLPEGGAPVSQSNTAFPYVGNYICTHKSLDEQYRPSINLGNDMRFTMLINTGQGMTEAAGHFAWDIQTGMLYLNFEQIGGGDPGEGYYEAEVKILSDTQIQFMTQGFGLMGAEDQFGIFTRQ